MHDKSEDKRMKFTLLVVGRTVEKHYITAINDYVERTKHFISFDMEVIPELKNTKSLSMEQQKEKEGELISKALQPGDVVDNTLLANQQKFPLFVSFGLIILIRLPHIGHAITVDVIGKIGTVTGTAHQFYHFFCRKFGASLPQAGHHAAHNG